MTSRDLLRLAAFLAAFGSALIHLVIAPEHMAEAAYVGWLFLAGGGLLLLVALAALTDDTVTRTREYMAAWHLGALVCAGMVVGLVLSRTTGLPGGYHEGWDEPEALMSLALELLFLGAWIGRLRVASTDRREEVSSDAEPAAEVQALGGQHDVVAGGGSAVQPRQLALGLTKAPMRTVPPAGAGRERPAAPKEVR